MTKIYKFSKQEIGDMIVTQIGIVCESLSFFPYSINKTNLQLPDMIEIELKFIPKGTKVNNQLHLFKEIQ